MRLLIIAQRADKNDANLGFFHKWIEEFAENAENVFVIAQFAGEYDFQDNVKIFSLGKERGFSKFRQIVNFYKLLFRNLKAADAVFVHMIPMWVVLGCPLFFIFRKKTYLWYVHKQVDFWFRISEKLINKIFTASPESCRIKSEKIIITGHGIDVKKFSIFNFQFSNKNQNPKFIIFSAGRISKIKNQKILIEAIDILINQKNIFDFELQIAGLPIMKNDFEYLEYLKNFIKEKKLGNYVKFLGGAPYDEIDKYYQNADLFINLSGTGSVDKAVLEAMSCGVNIITSNEAFFKILPKENILKELNPPAL